MVQRISREEVAHVARLAQLALSEDELDSFTSQLAAVLDHAADLEALNVDDVEPSTHTFDEFEPTPLQKSHTLSVIFMTILWS